MSVKKMINCNVSSELIHYYLRVCTELQLLSKTASRARLWFYAYKKYKNGNSARSTYLHIGQRIVTHVPVGFCTKFGDFHPELRIFMNFSWVIVMYHFVGCSNVYLKIIVKYEDDHHIRDPLTRDLDFPIFFLIDFKFWHVHFRLCHSVSF